MSGSKPQPPQPPAVPEEADKPDEPKSGRVAFDERGNAVWEWSMSTGAFGRDVDTKRLKKLEANDLKVQDDPAPHSKSLSVQPGKQPGGGFDPYNSSGTGPARGPARKAAQKPKDLKRLSDWIELQKSMGKKSDKD